jgi:hypothetical protein
MKFSNEALGFDGKVIVKVVILPKEGVKLKPKSQLLTILLQY